MYQVEQKTVDGSPWDIKILVNPDCTTHIKISLWNGQTFRLEFEPHMGNDDASVIYELREPNDRMGDFFQP